MLDPTPASLVDLATGAVAKTPAPHRAAAGQPKTADRLGPLRDLAGFREGIGFSPIARPNVSSDDPGGILLQRNPLGETTGFNPIGSPVSNRGGARGDIQFDGLNHLGRVTDAMTGSAPPIETGMWLFIPETTVPASDPSIVNDPQGQKISRILRLIASAPPLGGVANVPFIVRNADAPSLESVSAIKTVERSSGPEAGDLGDG